MYMLYYAISKLKLANSAETSAIYRSISWAAADGIYTDGPYLYDENVFTKD